MAVNEAVKSWEQRKEDTSESVPCCNQDAKNIGMANASCPENSPQMAVFLLLGFHSLTVLKPVLFIVFLTIYLFTVAGNILIIVTVASDTRLQSPMYVFLGNLSILETWYTTIISPTLLGSILGQGIIIPLPACFLQLVLFCWFTATECFLLTVMSYDRYVAICHPLRYATLIDMQFCLHLAVFTWAIGFLLSINNCIFLSMLQYHDISQLDHFFCDLTPLIQVACSDTSQIQLECFLLSIIVLSFPFTFLIVSYVYIISTILKIPSTKGKHKAFSTCSSHLTIVVAYFGILILMYMVPSAGNTNRSNKAFSLLYTVGTPLFNPIVYTLRNKEMKEALKKNMGQVCVFKWPGSLPPERFLGC